MAEKVVERDTWVVNEVEVVVVVSETVLVVTDVVDVERVVLVVVDVSVTMLTCRGRIFRTAGITGIDLVMALHFPPMMGASPGTSEQTTESTSSKLAKFSREGKLVLGI